MWFALLAGGPLGVMAVRLADSVPALVFGFHGGLVADRWDRRRTMIAADLVRRVALVPVAAAGLSGRCRCAASCSRRSRSPPPRATSRRRSALLPGLVGRA